ncbi:MAG TPA: phosphotransferase [Candidatus Limnocylindria bacterium]|nr:phosphotransferase [Candidatus Limnocylindria bacterium]
MASAACQTVQLHGGTLGDVRLLSGTAVLDDGESRPFRVVRKEQRKWERPGDPGSWRREADLYESFLAEAFTPSFRRPECYHLESGDDVTVLWLEYLTGVSGRSLTTTMLEAAAYGLGLFQRRAGRDGRFGDIPCLGDEGFLSREFSQWHTQSYSLEYLVSDGCRLPAFLKESLRSGKIALAEGKSLEYACLRSPACGIPAHIRGMIEGLDGMQEAVFSRLARQPIVLCHRDFWTENIFYSEASVALIDWDTAGWGYAGEDVASLIFDETDPDKYIELNRRMVPAYANGLGLPDSALPHLRQDVLTMALMKFGYRMVQRVAFAQEPEEKAAGIAALQAFYDLFRDTD